MVLVQAQAGRYMFRVSNKPIIVIVRAAAAIHPPPAGGTLRNNGILITSFASGASGPPIGCSINFRSHYCYPVRSPRSSWL